MADGATSTARWALPGSDVSAGPAADVVMLTAGVEEALSVLPSALPRVAAVARAEVLLALQERLSAASLRAVADVEERELWRERQAGSTRTWLRTLPSGDAGQVALARLLQDRPVLSRALADGEVSVRTAGLVARQLARVPAHVEADQLQGVLVDGLGDMVGVWAGAACLDPTPSQEAEFGARRALLARAVGDGLRDCWSDAAGQLEPAFTLAATVLAPAEVAAGLALLVDALQPDADAEAEQAYRDRGLVLRRVRAGGWSLRAHLTDEVGQRLFDELQARDPEGAAGKARATRQQGAEHPDGLGVEDVLGGHAGDQGGHHGPNRVQAEGEAHDPAESRAGADDPAASFGTAGPGLPEAETGRHVEGAVRGSRDQRAHDAFAQLLADLTTCRPGTGVPAPSHLTLTASLDALDRRPGAPPGRLVTSGGDVSLTSSQLRRLACGSTLSAVLIDARGRPSGASGTHRHATPRERRAMRTAWGSTCSVNGCTATATVPHHAEPWWKTQATTLKDLVPLCEHHHHDVHDRSKTLRLRDGRLLDEWGWADRR